MLICHIATITFLSLGKYISKKHLQIHHIHHYSRRHQKTLKNQNGKNT